MKNNWEKAIVSSSSSIRDVLQVISENSFRIVLVVDKHNSLLGTITDGDVRRGLLEEKTLDSLAEEVMNKNPIFADTSLTQEERKNLMIEEDILCLPILKKGKVISLQTLNEALEPKKYDNPVFLMAGGFGKRLRPLTEDVPKPLLKLGDKPILEIILERLAKTGFHEFYISTHYKPELVRKHFGNGKKWNVKITYIHEKMPLGTGGSLGLLPIEKIRSPVLVMNGDLLTNLDFNDFMRFHDLSGAEATICVNEYEHTIPFGVIESSKGRVKDIKEKPSLRNYVSAGIYILSPSIIKGIKKNIILDMPELIKNQIKKGLDVRMFPIHEYWLDIGRVGDYEKANEDFSDL